MMRNIILGMIAAIVLCGHGSVLLAQANNFTEEPIVFHSGDVALSGTILVHGAGRGLRSAYRRQAEAFAQAGILTLIYDKRTQGYSATGAGSRSYALLADDMLAAVKTLRTRLDVDPAAVGLWGLSEGAWVAPLAATRSGDIAFLVLVGAASVPPAQQEAWSIENKLRHQGVSGSLIHAMTRSFMRLLVASDLFSEATYDPVAVLAQVQQPILALWGALDRTAVPAESAAMMHGALKAGGNSAYSLRFLPQADHDLHQTVDGFVPQAAFAVGYFPMVTDWVHRVQRGEALPVQVDQLPPQARSSSAWVITIPWYEADGWWQLGLFSLLVLAFATYPLSTLLRWLGRQKRPLPAVPVPLPWLARGLVCTGMTSVLGLVGYLFTLLMSEMQVGTLLAGRTLPWLGLQCLALATLLLTVALGLTWGSKPTAVSSPERWRLVVLMLGGLLFMPWAIHWGLLMP